MTRCTCRSQHARWAAAVGPHVFGELMRRGACACPAGRIRPARLSPRGAR